MHAYIPPVGGFLCTNLEALCLNKQRFLFSFTSFDACLLESCAPYSHKEHLVSTPPNRRNNKRPAKIP